MSRAQQGAIESTESADSAASTTAATTSQAEEQADINQNQSQLAKFAADNPYVQGGTMQTAENQELSNTADATAAAAAAKNQQQAQRTGQNAAAPVAAGEAEQQAAQRSLSSEEAGATTSRLASGAQYGAEVLGAGNSIAAQQAQLSSNLTGEAQGQEGTAEQAAQTPSFLDELGQGLISSAGQAGSAAITAYCPARGTIYLACGGIQRRVEDLEIGDFIAGIDGEDQLIEEIQTAILPVLRTTAANGFVVRTSAVHAFALPIGGFAVAAKSMGKTILTSDGPSRVISVEPDGVAEVFNIITDGSHTYLADGFWSLGVGDAERNVPMEEWGEIGSRLAQAGGDHGNDR